jgi:hypothetical protein
MTSIRQRVLRAFLRSRYKVVDDLTMRPRPDDDPHVHAPGIDPDRVLVFGNGPAVGWGVRCHDLAIPGHLARRLSTLTGRGADVDVVADRDMTIEHAVEHLPDRELCGYDVVVVVVGMSDALTLLPAHKWRRSLSRLLDALELVTSPTASIIVAGIQPPSTVPGFGAVPGGVVDRHAGLLNETTRALCATRPSTHVMPAPPMPGATDALSRDAGRYQAWGSALAEVAAPLVDSALADGRSARASRHAPQSDERRVEAIRALGLLDSPAEKRFDDIVDRARILLGTQGAAFSLITDDRHWNKAVSGSSRIELPLADSFCAHTIRSGRPLVVPDAWRDDRFVSHPAIRFYAGHPIETDDGVRIGALCVVDAEPRGSEGVDLVLLRELALAVQRELRIRPGDDTDASDAAGRLAAR